MRSAACFRAAIALSASMALFGAGPGGAADQAAGAKPGYFRFPAIHGDTLVFTAEGDLWTAPLAGGAARRLTSHAGEESHAAISGDGRWLAFGAAYDSTREAYVMPLAGGEPKRVSFEADRVWVQGWTPEGEVLYATDNQSGPGGRRVLRAVDPTTLAVRTLPLDDAHEAAIDPAGGRVYFTRMGLQLTGDNAKGYRGGALAQLWRFDPGSGAEAVRVGGDVAAAEHRPMWWNGQLYFLSDADGTHNLWAMAADGSGRRQLTRHRGWDARGASQQGGRIVYQLGADLRRLDLASGEDQAVPLELVSDFEQRHVRYHQQPLEFLTSANFAADGKQVLLTARGRMAKVASGALRRVEIAVPPQVRARAGVLSVDGRHVYAIADTEGRQEIWRYAADGSGEARALTSDGASHRWRLVPSPDGRWLAHHDGLGQLWLLDLKKLENRKIDSGPPMVGDDIYGVVVWSPDSAHLALVRPDSARSLNQLLLYSVAQRRLERLTSDRYESFAPAFTPDGRWLYFVSNRNFQASPESPWGDRNMGPSFDRRGKVYAYSLQAGTRFPFRSLDELAADKDAGEAEDAAEPDDDSAKTKKDKDAGKAKAKPKDTAKDTAKDAKPRKPLPAVEWSGLTDRLYEVPVAPGNYSALATDGERLYLLDRAAGADAEPVLKTLAIDDSAPKTEVFAAGVREFALSADAKKLFFMKWNPDGAGDMFVVDAGAKAPEDLGESEVRVGDWVLELSPVDEWRQMFADAWRMHRDFAFDRKLRGLDWNAVRAKYEPLVERLTDRAELDDLLRQMSSELGILHSQVGGAELRKDAELAKAAFLGARFARDPEGARIERIYRTERELPGERGPLQQPGVDVREGDLVLAVNGRAVSSVSDIAQLLHNQAGQQVLLRLRRGTLELRAVVVPVPRERDAMLRYRDWVETRRAQVEQASGGRIGYLHLRAMTGADIATFARDFYANVEREGLIIDVRRNSGGSIDSWIIEKLLRRSWAYWQNAQQQPFWNMQQTFRGHLAVLIDQLTYSDGETFAAGIQALGLGPLIGMRTAGAGVWLTDRNSLVDNGIARVAEFGQFRADGSWLIEGHGVQPDVEVENPPHASFLGKDLQLEAALDHLSRKLQESPLPVPQPQAIPPVGEGARPSKPGERP